MYYKLHGGSGPAAFFTSQSERIFLRPTLRRTKKHKSEWKRCCNSFPRSSANLLAL